MTNQALEHKMVVSIIKPWQKESQWRQCSDLPKNTWGLEEGRRGRKKTSRGKNVKQKVVLLFVRFERGFSTSYVCRSGDHPKLFPRRQDFCTKFA